MNQDTITLLHEEHLSQDSPESPVERNGNHSYSSAKKWPQHIAALTATLSALSAGTVLGWTSPILSEIQHGNLHNITVNDDQLGWIGSFVTLGGMSMCIPTGFLCDLLGRKRTLLLLIIPFSIGWSLIICANSVTMLYFGRLITGMASGASCVAAPLYISEIAQKEIRGILGTYFQLMVTVGIFLAYFSGKFLGALNYTIFCATMPIIFIICFVFQPESPVYCLRKGMHDKALMSLVKLRGPLNDNEGELSEMDGALKENIETTVSFTETLKRKAFIKAIFIALALMFFQQFSGINAVILYTSDIFSAAHSNLDPKTAAICVGAFQVIATFLSSLVIDRLGRVALLVFSAVMASLSTLVLAVYFTLKTRTDIELGFLPVLALCVFVIVFSFGLGPIPWIISSEIFMPEVKSIASSVAGTFNWFLAFLVTKFYLQVSDHVGDDTTFYIFSAASFVGAIFIYMVLPETKGRTIEEIQVELED